MLLLFSLVTRWSNLLSSTQKFQKNNKIQKDKINKLKQHIFSNK